MGRPTVAEDRPAGGDSDGAACACIAGAGRERVAIATYYGDELNDAIVRYFAPLRHRGHGAGRASLRRADRKPSTRLRCELWTKCPTCRSTSTARAATRRLSSRSMRSTSTAAVGMLRRQSISWNGTSAPRWSSRWPRKCGQPIAGSRSSFRYRDCGALLRDNPARAAAFGAAMETIMAAPTKSIVTGAAQGIGRAVALRARRARGAYRGLGHAGRRRRGHREAVPANEVRGRARAAGRCRRCRRGRGRGCRFRAGMGRAGRAGQQCRHFSARAGARHAAIGMGARAARQSHR